MAQRPISRRTVLRFSATCSLPLAGILAGCPSPGRTVLDEDSEQNESTSVPEATNRSEDQEPSIKETPVNDRPLTSAPNYGDWFNNVGNYRERTVVYTQDELEIRVRVGAEGNGGNQAYEYPAIAIPKGAIVIWTWTGEGGAHNVVAVDENFASGEPIESAEATFEVSFERRGTYRYYCETHRTDGMKGAITVY